MDFVVHQFTTGESQCFQTISANPDQNFGLWMNLSNQADPIFELSRVKLCPQNTKKGQLGFNWPANSTQIFVK